MPRILGQVKNRMQFTDNLSGDTIVLYYRHPTTEERVAYSNMSLQRQGNELVVNRSEARMKYGLQILVGFRDGDFLDQDNQPLTCNDNWKEKLMDGGSDLVELLAANVFDMSCGVSAGKTVADKTADLKTSEDSPSGNLQETSPQ